MLKNASFVGTLVLMSLLATAGCGGVPESRDVTGPTVTKTSPASGETNVPVNAVVDVWFSEDIISNSLLPATVFIDPDPGHMLSFPEKDHLRIVFLDNVPYDSEITVVINPGISDLDDNPMKTGYGWSYFTQPNTNPTPPITQGGTKGLLSNRNPYALSGSKQFGTELVVNGKPQPDVGLLIPFTVQVPLEEGPNQIRLQARRKTLAATKYLYSQTTLVQIVLDTVPPAVPVPSPLPPATTIQDQIAIGGSLAAGDKIKGSLNGVALSIESGVATWSALLLLQEGNNLLSLLASDMAGNQSSAYTFVILKDSTPPQLTMNPVPQITNSAQISLVGSSDEAAQFYVDGIAVSNGTLLSNNYNLAEGNNSIHVAAVDALGNRSQTVLYSFRDSTAPTLLATLPAPGFKVTNAVTALRYIYDEPLGSTPSPTDITSQTAGITSTAAILEAGGRVIAASVSVTQTGTYFIYSDFAPSDPAGNAGLAPDWNFEITAGVTVAPLSPMSLTLSAAPNGDTSLFWSAATVGSWYALQEQAVLDSGTLAPSLQVTSAISVVLTNDFPAVPVQIDLTSLLPDGRSSNAATSTTATIESLADLNQSISLIGSDDIRLAAGDLNNDTVMDLLVAYPTVSRVEYVAPAAPNLMGWKGAVTTVINGSGHLGDRLQYTGGKLWITAPDMNSRAGCIFRLDPAALPASADSSQALICGDPGAKLGSDIAIMANGSFWTSAPGLNAGSLVGYSASGLVQHNYNGASKLHALGNWQIGSELILGWRTAGSSADFVLLDSANGSVIDTLTLAYDVYDPVVATVDFNGDGIQDLIIVSPGSNPVARIYSGGWYPDLNQADRVLNLPAGLANRTLAFGGVVRSAGKAQQCLLKFGTGATAGYASIVGAPGFFSGQGGVAAKLHISGDNLLDHVLGEIDFDGNGKLDIVYRPSLSGKLVIQY